MTNKKTNGLTKSQLRRVAAMTDMPKAIEEELEFLRHRTTTLMNMIDAMCRSMGRDFKIVKPDVGDPFILWEPVDDVAESPNTAA